ncbi:MAG: linear amide C-N hydrolase [Endozoicomonas sp.]
MMHFGKKLLLAASVATVLTGITDTASACTRVLWETQDHGVFVGRTMDWLEPNHPTIDVRAKGQSYRGYDGDNALEWTSKYSSIGVSLYGVGLVDGFNETGFSANALFLDEEAPGEKDNNKKQVQNARLIAYLLDSFATVEEALENIDSLQVQQFEHNGIAMKGHYSLQDASGDSAILQFIDGKWQVYHGKEYTVMTNSPTYQEHLDNWEAAKPKTESDYRGTFELPGNVSSDQRFIWNQYMRQQLTEPTSYTNGLAKTDSAMYKVPMDAANREVNGQMAGYATIYSLAYNLDQKTMQVRYQFEDTYTHYYVDFEELNNGKNYSIAADKDDLFGNITDRLQKRDGVMAQYRISG